MNRFLSGFKIVILPKLIYRSNLRRCKGKKPLTSSDNVAAHECLSKEGSDDPGSLEVDGSGRQQGMNANTQWPLLVRICDVVQ
jgi:hypothetical protein